MGSHGTDPRSDSPAGAAYAPRLSPAEAPDARRPPGTTVDGRRRPAARQNGSMALHPDPASHPRQLRCPIGPFGQRPRLRDLRPQRRAPSPPTTSVRLPYAIKVLLENLLRHEDGPHVSADDIAATAGWGANPEAHGQAAGDAAHEIALTPERVLMQDFTGVPGVVDLAAMRDALARLGGDPAQVNPLVPVELVIDHSVIAERSGDPDVLRHRTSPSSTSATWSATSCCAGPSSAFDGFRVVPPGMGICHQVNLEYLSRVVFADRRRPGLLRHPGRHRFPHHHGQRTRACSAGASAASRPRRPCSASPSPCCSRRWSGSASPASCRRAPPRPTWS